MNKWLSKFEISHKVEEPNPYANSSDLYIVFKFDGVEIAALKYIIRENDSRWKEHNVILYITYNFFRDIISTDDFRQAAYKYLDKKKVKYFRSTWVGISDVSNSNF